jgi:hypothetical protein
MDAKLNIHFKRQADGSVLVTAVMTETGTSKPGFYRVRLAPDADPLAVYNEVAAQAISYILARKSMATFAEDAAGGKPPTGRLIQLRGVLPK